MELSLSKNFDVFQILNILINFFSSKITKKFPLDPEKYVPSCPTYILYGINKLFHFHDQVILEFLQKNWKISKNCKSSPFLNFIKIRKIRVG